MRHALDQFTAILSIKPQINLQFMNTFFALSIASYYVVMHHTPQGLRWPSHLKFYEVQKDVIEENPQLEGFSSSSQLSFVLELKNKNLPLLNKSETGEINLIQNQSLENVLEESKSMQDLLSLNPSLPFQSSDTLIEDRHPMKISSQIGLKERIVKFLPPSHSLELPKIATQEIVITNALLNPICTNKIAISENRVATELGGKTGNNLNPVGEEMISPSPLLKAFQLHSFSIPLSEDIQELEGVTTENKEEVVSSLTHPIIPKPEEKTENNADTFPAWFTYKRRLESPLLKLWLMKLAPGSSVKPKEIPFRRALIETLLSEEFQPHIGPNWEPPIGPGWEPSGEEVDGNDDEDIKARRRNFHDTYLKKVDWAATRFKRLFLIDGSEDFHQVNEEAYLKAYNFPLKLGVRVYRDEDFCL